MDHSFYKYVVLRDYKLIDFDGNNANFQSSDRSVMFVGTHKCRCSSPRGATYYRFLSLCGPWVIYSSLHKHGLLKWRSAPTPGWCLNLTPTILFTLVMLTSRRQTESLPPLTLRFHIHCRHPTSLLFAAYTQHLCAPFLSTFGLEPLRFPPP